MFGGGVVGHPKQLKAGRHVLDDPSGEVVATPGRCSPDTRTIAKPVETKHSLESAAGNRSARTGGRGRPDQVNPFWLYLHMEPAELYLSDLKTRQKTLQNTMRLTIIRRAFRHYLLCHTGERLRHTAPQQPRGARAPSPSDRHSAPIGKSPHPCAAG